MLLWFQSRLTNDSVYENVARKAIETLYNKRDGTTGLLANEINIVTGDWTSNLCGLGAGMDSYYEYLLKVIVVVYDHLSTTAWKINGWVQCERYWKRINYWYIFDLGKKLNFVQLSPSKKLPGSATIKLTWIVWIIYFNFHKKKELCVIWEWAWFWNVQSNIQRSESSIEKRVLDLLLSCVGPYKHISSAYISIADNASIHWFS
jgi:hypothetical protein